MNWLFCVLCVFVLHVCSSEDTTSAAAKVKCPKVCICQNTSVICGKTKHGLREIPKIPANVNQFTFLNGNISTVNKAVLSPISKCPLYYLALRFDNITVLSKGTFEDFHQLKTLDISENNIPVELLKDAFLSLSNKLEHFVLENMNINNIPKDLFKAQNTHIKTLDFNHNKLMLFDNNSVLEEMPVLDKLSLSYNNIMSISGSNAKLTVLNLDYNWFTNVPDFCLPNGSSRFNRLKTLDMNNNNMIKSLNRSSFSCLTNLESLKLNQNKINVLENNTFSNLPSLKGLYLNGMTSLKKIDELAFNSSSLLILSLMNLKVTKETFPRNFPFKWAPRLRQLVLMNSNLNILSTSSFKEMLSQLTSVTSLDLQNTQLKTIPSFSLSQIHKLETLHLGSNHLSTWDDNTFANLTNLKYINLNNNQIHLINETSFPIETRMSINRMSLGHNDFVCTCDLQWFRTWMDQVMKNKTVKFVKYPENYYCKEPKHIGLDKFNPTYASCHRFTISPYVLVAIVLGSFVLLLIVVIILIYRYRWKIRYYMCTKQQYQRLPGRDDRLVFDAFVILSNEDLDWVMKEIMDFLENDRTFKLCVSQRDFQPGKRIVDNISESIEKSKKIILILSNSFVNSQWCQFETALAVKMNKDVVVVKLEKVATHLMSSDLRNLTNSSDCISWEHDDAARGVFRRRLEEKLSRTIC